MWQDEVGDTCLFARERQFDMGDTTKRVAWISEFPIEWLSDLPAPLESLPKQHSLTWQRVLFDELKKDQRLKLHVIALRKNLERDYSFDKPKAQNLAIKMPSKG